MDINIRVIFCTTEVIFSLNTFLNGTSGGNRDFVFLNYYKILNLVAHIEGEECRLRVF